MPISQHGYLDQHLTDLALHFQLPLNPLILLLLIDRKREVSTEYTYLCQHNQPMLNIVNCTVWVRSRVNWKPIVELHLKKTSKHKTNRIERFIHTNKKLEPLIKEQRIELIKQRIKLGNKFSNRHKLLPPPQNARKKCRDFSVSLSCCRCPETHKSSHAGDKGTGEIVLLAFELQREGENHHNESPFFAQAEFPSAHTSVA